MIEKTDKDGLVAFIPVRGGSKSIPRKNIKEIAGKPLVQWVIDAAANAKCIDTVYVATDSAEITNIVTALGYSKVKVIGRSPETATDTASTESALIEFCNSHSFEHVFLIQATSPLLSATDLDKCWDSYTRENVKNDSMLSVVRQKRFIWEAQGNKALPVNYSPEQRPRRQDFEGYLVENGAFYLSSRKNIIESGCRISGVTGIYEMNESSYYEIDEPSDWLIVESLLRSKEKKNRNVDTIKMVVMDCDGVMTDAGMYYSESGEFLKKFNTRDGKGIELLREAGIKTAIITSESTPYAEQRARKLKIDHITTGSKQKAHDLKKISKQSGIKIEEIAYIGDDVNDLPAMLLCGFSACPHDAVEKVKAVADIVLDKKGGEGAVRALADLILAKNSD